MDLHGVDIQTGRDSDYSGYSPHLTSKPKLVFVLGMVALTVPQIPTLLVFIIRWLGVLSRLQANHIGDWIEAFIYGILVLILSASCIMFSTFTTRIAIAYIRSKKRDRST